MSEINERFKDLPPEQTVEMIRGIFERLGIEIEEVWFDSEIDNLYSLHMHAKGASPFIGNGKGVSKALARASAYGEFIEQLQCGLNLYKFQSITRDPEMDLQKFAPDGKYMTLEEVIANGEWMDYIIDSYGGDLSRQKLAQLCKNFSCSDDDRIWTLPFYSVFEDKCVYIPAGFMLQLYAANGGCAGNTREEAWIHGLSEIIERRSIIDTLNGKIKPIPIPDEVIQRYPVPAGIMDSIRGSGLYDVKLFDVSSLEGYPVISARIINKKTQEYLFNMAADPVMEIAIDRTLTESFQGRALTKFQVGNHGQFAEEAGDIPREHNLLNQIELDKGVFSMELFTQECDTRQGFREYGSRDHMNNKQLLEYQLEQLRKIGKPVYVRNFSFLGFHSYQFIIPGFSETRVHHLSGSFGEYAMGDKVQKTLRNPAAATDADLAMMLMFHNRIRTAVSRCNNFRGLAGLPLDKKYSVQLLYTELAYAAFRLKRLPQAEKYLQRVVKSASVTEEEKEYYACVLRYIQLEQMGIDRDKIRYLLTSFFNEKYVTQLFELLDDGKTPFDPYLVRCDRKCDQCRYAHCCDYESTRQLIGRLGAHYREFTDGQNANNFKN